MATASQQEWQQRLIRRHHVWGWCSLFAFVSFGLALDGLHAFKIGAYLDPSLDTPRALLQADWYHNTRRFLWMLAHQHGTQLALVNLAFAFALRFELLAAAGRIRLASYFLLNATVLMPLGFFLGGIDPSEGDPWIGIWLVPVGAGLLFLAVLMIALEALSHGGGDAGEEPTPASEQGD
jgi:hypothetical protein